MRAYLDDDLDSNGPAAARERMGGIKGLALLDITPEVEMLAAGILASGVIPQAAATDTAHIAIRESRSTSFATVAPERLPAPQVAVEMAACTPSFFTPDPISRPKRLARSMGAPLPTVMVRYGGQLVGMALENTTSRAFREAGQGHRLLYMMRPSTDWASD